LFECESFIKSEIYYLELSSCYSVRVLLLARYVISTLNDINKVLLESSVFSLYYYLGYFVLSAHVALKRKQEISVGEDHGITREDSVTKIKQRRSKSRQDLA
jgi:hypothetical protein